MKNKKYLIVGITALALVMIVIGTTYAFFTANIAGNESGSTISATGGILEIIYDNKSGVISVDNIYPRETAWLTKTFTVTGTNTTDLDMEYAISLSVDINTFTDNSLSYSLTSVNTTNNGDIVPSCTNQPISGELEIGTGKFVNGTNAVHTYTFELFFKDNGKPQNANQHAKFVGHIEIGLPKMPLVLTADNYHEIVQFTDNGSHLVIPATFQGAAGTWYKVTEIGDNAFSDLSENSTIKRVTIPDTVTVIGQNAFRRFRALEDVNIPNSVSVIGNSAFENCTNLKGDNGNLVLSDSITYIGEKAFVGCTSLNGKLVIPGSIKQVSSRAFMQTNFNEILIHEGVEYIGSYAFRDTKKLEKIVFPSSINLIEKDAFMIASAPYPSIKLYFWNSEEESKNVLEKILNTTYLQYIDTVNITYNYVEE